MTDETDSESALLVLKVAARNLSVGVLTDAETLDITRIEQLPHRWLAREWEVGEVINLPLGSGPATHMVQTTDEQGRFGPKEEQPIQHSLWALKEEFEGQRYDSDLMRDAYFLIHPQLQKQELKLEVADTYRRIQDRSDMEIQTVKDVAAHHGISVRSVYRYCNDVLDEHERMVKPQQEHA